MITTTVRLLAALLLVFAASPVATSAEASSDIPGVALPGPSVSGELGGSIYDVVYRVEVKPGYVIVAGLTGSAGTDFDLYLFDSSATTVESNQGLLARSIGPTSSEHLNYPSMFGGTYYIDLNGATDVMGQYMLTVQLVADSSVPVASLLLAHGSARVNTATVPITVTAVSPLSGVVQMALSTDGKTFGPWLPYSVDSMWTFEAGDGTKTLWVKVLSGTGVESAPVSASIILDTVPPVPVSIIPVPQAAVFDVHPVFSVRFDEPISGSTWSSSGLIVQAPDGTNVPGDYAYDARTWTGTFRPRTDLIAGLPYVVTIGPVMDIAGNVMQSLGSWTVTPLHPASIAAGFSTLVAPRGATVSLGATTVGLDGQIVFLERRSQTSGDWVVVRTLMAGGGDVSTTVTADSNATYRWSYAGSSVSAPAESGPQRVLVRRAIALIGRTSAAVYSARPGQRISLVASIAPAVAGVGLSYKLYRYDAVRGRFVYAGSYGRTSDASGRSTLAWTPRAGRYYWRVAVASTPEYANNVSGDYRWVVRY